MTGARLQAILQLDKYRILILLYHLQFLNALSKVVLVIVEISIFLQSGDHCFSGSYRLWVVSELGAC